MIQREVIAGDTFPIAFTYQDANKNPIDLPEGYDYVIGLHQEGGKTVKVFSYQNGDIKNPETGVYKWEADHEFSMQLKGVIIVEMVIYSRDGSFVRHCKEPIRLTVLESFMNEYLDIE